MSAHLAMGVVLLSCLVSAITMLTLLPLIFWIFVVPKIEKRIGKELKFNYSVLPFGKYLCGYIELAFTITLMYLNLRILRDNSKIKLHRLALVTAEYDVSSATQVELVLSFIVFVCMTLFVISLFLMFLIPILYPLRS